MKLSRRLFAAKRERDPVVLLNRLAREAESDPGFWILTSAAAHLNGYDLNDGDPSTVATYFPEPEASR